jgi:hypothetical protein
MNGSERVVQFRADLFSCLFPAAFGTSAQVGFPKAKPGSVRAQISNLLAILAQ